MTIRDEVARALYDNAGEALSRGVDSTEHWLNYTDLADTAINAFLAAAAEEGWRMAKDEATEEMVLRAVKTPGMKAVDGAITIASVHGFKLQPASWRNSPIAEAFRAMLAAAPEFEIDG